MVLRRIQRHFVVGVLFSAVGAIAFTGSRSTPTKTCSRRSMPLPVCQSAPSAVWSAFGLEGQLQYLGDGASHRIQPAKSRSRIFRRRTALFAKRGRPKIPDEELAGKKEQLRILLCATEPEIEKLVKNCKGVLTSSDIVENHGPKVAMLQETLGISQKAAGRMCLNANRLLSSTLETLVSKIDWLQARLNLSKTQLKTILTRAPGTLTLSIDDNIQPKLDNVQSVLELSDKELTEMVVKSPHLLNHNFSKKMAARLSFLQILLNIEEDDLATLRKAIFQRPDILFYPEERMIEVQHWISDRLGLSDARVAQMSRNKPLLLTSKISTLGIKVASLQTALSLSDEELGKLFGQLPTLFTFCPKKNLEPKLRFLRLTFDLDDEQLKELLLRVPNLFSLSEDIIEEKLQFYSELVGTREAKRIVMESTNLLNISLKTRLRPRLAGVEKAGVKVEWSEQLMQRLARRSDDQWERYGLGDAPRGRAAHTGKKK